MPDFQASQMHPQPQAQPRQHHLHRHQQQDPYNQSFPSPQLQHQHQHQQPQAQAHAQSPLQRQQSIPPLPQSRPQSRPTPTTVHNHQRSQPQPSPPQHQQHQHQQSFHANPEPQYLNPQTQHQPQSQPQQPHYVSLQDLQQNPVSLHPQPQVSTMGNTLGTVKREPQMEDVKSVQDCITAQPPRATSRPVARAEDSITVKTHDIAMPDAKPEYPRVKSSPHSSVANSPAQTARSPSISKKSPAVQHKPRPVDTLPIMVAVAEECLDKAHASVHDVAMSMHPDFVDEYQRLIATSLACLEATLQSNRLTPRDEARVRLRYAALLQEETENLMVAETALTKGIALCDKHRLFDLKYCMQYLMLKVLFQRNHRAALSAVDRHISDCETFKHVQWYYAFRLLKALFYIEMDHASEAGAFDNIRAIQNVAKVRGDNALGVFAALLEGLALLKTPKQGTPEKVQACIALAAKYQLDATVTAIPQLNILTSLVEVASMLNVQNPELTAGCLRTLQRRLDECDEWHNVKSNFLLPVKKQPAAAKTVSAETAAIILPGNANSEYDFVAVSFMTKMELRSLVFAFSGLVSLHKPANPGRRSTDYWQEGLKILDAWDSSTAGYRYGPDVSLNTAVKQRAWRVEAQTYLNLLLGLLAASHCEWETVRAMMAKLGNTAASKQQTVILLSVYLTGVYHQGTGDLQTALRIFSDTRFDVTRRSGSKAGQSELALLANMNRLWIMQHPSCRDDQTTLDLVEILQPLCAGHANLELRIAWHNVAAALVTDPPQQLNQKKQHMHAAIGGTKVTNNCLAAAVTLCIMRFRFFENVIGEQALKSALAAAKQAQKSGNLLLQSVADGMLAQSYEVQGQRQESMQEWDKATKEAKNAFLGSS
ncbi:hypothetical protein S40288_02982 [Stachybotrys chartarum IBT 40288]|nr:hypothetical protein S40288_02982 [Stachybotrys chartarum IBT 40288]